MKSKDEIEQAEDGWAVKAAAEGWRCVVCGAVPIYDERQVYPDTGMCGSCTHNMSKDD